MERSHRYPLNFSGSKFAAKNAKKKNDQDASKQRARNVPLASADVRGAGRLCDNSKECLHRRLQMEGVANGTSKNMGFGEFWQDLKISKAVLISLKVSFLHGLFLHF